MFIGACSVTSKGRKGRQGRHFLHEGIPFLPCIIADATFLTIADAMWDSRVGNTANTRCKICFRAHMEHCAMALPYAY